MKKYCKFIIFCVLIFSLIFLSCNNILLSKGSSLSIRLPGTEQSRFAFEKPDNLDSFTIILTKKNGKTQEKTAKAGETIVFDSLTADTYTVSAKAFDKDNNCAAYAQEEVLIKPKQNTNLVLNLTWNLLTQDAIDNDEVDFVVTPPKKTTYTLGEYFDPTGLKVEAVFKNGYRQEIPALILSDTGPSQPIYYDSEPSLDNTTEITTDSASFKIGITITPLQELQSNHWYQTIENPFTLTLNVPKPTILQGPNIDNTSNTSNEITIWLETTDPIDTDSLGYSQHFQWYMVENGKGIPLVDTTGNTTFPQYSNATEQILTITFDSNDTNTYQYYCEVTNSIQKTPDEIPGITYGTTTATTKSKIVTVTTKGSSSDPGTTTVPTVPNYKIGDVYPQSGEAMGVVFEVDADNSYIKIVALQEVNNKSFDEGGWIETTDAQYFLDKYDGSQNKLGLETVISNYAENYNSISDYPAFDFCNNYTVLSDSSDLHTWYLPAINEILAIIQTNFSTINTSITTENGTELSTTYGYVSSTMQEGSTNYYYCTAGKDGSQTCNVVTAQYVRPVKKITL